MKAIINVENLKCGGCVSSIKNGLLTIKNVNEVKIDMQQGTVEVDYQGENTLAAVKIKLKDLGYPETGTVKGFEKVTTNVKSYVSCAIGKITNEEEK
ncbi:MAG: heavy metal transporter [Bacteroidetes bacterium]|jgi:copper chaperone|nr:heavy metal transporter [Bacteroidota bacterium]